MTDEQTKCRNPHCDTTIAPARRPTLFCWSCESVIQQQRVELSADLDKVLRLEAQFVAWCDEHGLPNPHE